MHYNIYTQLKGVNETTNQPAFFCRATIASPSSVLQIKVMYSSVFFRFT